jgi:large subunit ribosomal protein L30
VADRVTPGRRVRLTLRRSLIGRPERQRRIVWALGLRRIRAGRVYTLTPAVEGALRKISHLVQVDEVTDGQDR